MLRINRLFESDGEAGIRRFERIINRYTRAGYDTELQVRYHPSVRQRGKIGASGRATSGAWSTRSDPIAT